MGGGIQPFHCQHLPVRPQHVLLCLQPLLGRRRQGDRGRPSWRHRQRGPRQPPRRLGGGGQAIFNIIAAVFADTDASTDVEADTNFNCARNLDAMFQVNEGAIIKNVDGTTYEPATEAAEIAGDMPGAVSFPTWYVAIGTDAIGLGSTGFVVPNGFCYTNACMTEFMKTVLDGDFELGNLIKDPNMANPVTSSSKCGQALTACGSAAGDQSITGNTDKWDGKEWPVPMEDYVASTDGEGNIATDAVAAGTAILPSALTNGGDDYADITAFRGPVF